MHHAARVEGGVGRRGGEEGWGGGVAGRGVKALIPYSFEKKKKC